MYYILKNFKNFYRLLIVSIQTESEVNLETYNQNKEYNS